MLYRILKVFSYTYLKVINIYIKNREGIYIIIGKI